LEESGLIEGGRIMPPDRPVIILASDPALLSSLEFALSVEGFDLQHEGEIALPNVCLIVDQDRVGGGLAFLRAQRAAGNLALAILLVTHPDARLRTSARSLGVHLLEKPLRSDDLSRLIKMVYVPPDCLHPATCGSDHIVKQQCQGENTLGRPSKPADRRGRHIDESCSQ
jgi:hypothetical protein